MAQVKDILRFLEKMAPPEMKMDFDNVGLLAGWPDKDVTRAIVALDITCEVIDEAAELGAQLIVSHHPLIRGMNSVRADDYTGMRIIKLVQNGISAICMHTNLDAANGGVNDALARAVGIVKKTERLLTDGVLNGEEYGMGRVGELEKETTMSEYLPYVKSALRSNGLRYHDSGRPVKRVAVLGGSGSDAFAAAVSAGADTYITADVKYDVFLQAKALGVNLIDADHFCTENTVVPVLREAMSSEFKDVEFTISGIHCQTAQFFC